VRQHRAKRAVDDPREFIGSLHVGAFDQHAHDALVEIALLEAVHPGLLRNACPYRSFLQSLLLCKSDLICNKCFVEHARSGEKRKAVRHAMGE
jgi:hypothetical protein